MSLVLYDSPVSGNCYKVRLLLAHLGMPYERRDARRRRPLEPARAARRAEPGAARADARARRRPRRSRESGAILWYFGEGTRFVPDDRVRARAGAAVDVLRAVRPRAGDRGRALLGRVLRPCRRRSPSGSRSAWPRATGRSRRWSGTSRSGEWFVGDGHVARRHRALRLHARRARGRLRARARIPAIRAWLARVAAPPGPRADRRVEARHRRSTFVTELFHHA